MDRQIIREIDIFPTELFVALLGHGCLLSLNNVQYNLKTKVFWVNYEKKLSKKGMKKPVLFYIHVTKYSSSIIFFEVAFFKIQL